MLHPLFSTLIQRPDLVVEHTAAYAALFTEEATAAGTEIVVKVIAWAMAVLAGVIFLGLAGTAIMLGAIHSQFHWALAVVPGVALLLVVVAVVIAIRPFKSERFPELRAQLDSDARALRMAS